MNIESRLAKQEGINKSRSEKVENAKAYALKHFGTCSPAALKRLHDTIKPIEDELTLVNEKANIHLESCLCKVENDIDLSEQDIELAQSLISQQRQLKEQIQFHRDELLRHPPDEELSNEMGNIASEDDAPILPHSRGNTLIKESVDQESIDKASGSKTESESFQMI